MRIANLSSMDKIDHGLFIGIIMCRLSALFPKRTNRTTLVFMRAAFCLMVGQNFIPSPKDKATECSGFPSAQRWTGLISRGQLDAQIGAIQNQNKVEWRLRKFL